MSFACLILAVKGIVLKQQPPPLQKKKIVCVCIREGCLPLFLQLELLVSGTLCLL